MLDLNRVRCGPTIEIIVLGLTLFVVIECLVHVSRFVRVDQDGSFHFSSLVAQGPVGIPIRIRDVEKQIQEARNSPDRLLERLVEVQVERNLVTIDARVSFATDHPLAELTIQQRTPASALLRELFGKFRLNEREIGRTLEWEDATWVINKNGVVNFTFRLTAAHRDICIDHR